MIKKFSFVFFMTFILAFSTAFGPTLTNAQTFQDVPTNHTHAQNIERLTSYNIINGYGNGYFGINDPIRREHAVLLIYKILKDDKPAVRSYTGFKDVTASSANFDAIKWAYEAGIIDGSDGYFNPSKNITRQEMAKILVEAFRLSSNGQSTISDVDRNSWAYPYINTLANVGITQLYQNKFNPFGNTTRGEMASFLVRTVDYKNFQLKPYVDPPNQTPPVTNEEVDTKQVFASGWGDMNWHVWEGKKTLHLKGYSGNAIVGEYVKGEGKSLANIKIGMSKNEVQSLTKSAQVTSIQYKNGQYKVGDEKEYLIFTTSNQYVTVFFDVHNGNKVTSILAINKSLYSVKPYYPVASAKLQESYEDLMVVLINQSRKEFGLKPLKNVNDQWNFIVRAHSKDMINRDYFAHTSPDGVTFDQRLTKGGVKYRTAGENLAMGQESIIHAHEGLMNSAGHRRNILNGAFENVIVGVEFNSYNAPYVSINKFTQ